jgi:copper oxidase (laccase) domain-containing protein
VNGRLDLHAAAERALREGGCDTIERVDLCTSCRDDLFFSHRRDQGRTGRQGVIGYVA